MQSSIPLRGNPETKKTRESRWQVPPCRHRAEAKARMEERAEKRLVTQRDNT